MLALGALLSACSDAAEREALRAPAPLLTQQDGGDTIALHLIGRQRALFAALQAQDHAAVAAQVGPSFTWFDSLAQAAVPGWSAAGPTGASRRIEFRLGMLPPPVDSIPDQFRIVEQFRRVALPGGGAAVIVIAGEGAGAISTFWQATADGWQAAWMTRGEFGAPPSGAGPRR